MQERCRIRSLLAGAKIANFILKKPLISRVSMASHAFSILENTFFQLEGLIQTTSSTLIHAKKFLEDLRSFLSILDALDLYSSNESLEDLLTSSLKYLFTLKVTLNDLLICRYIIILPIYASSIVNYEKNMTRLECLQLSSVIVVLSDFYV